MVGRRRREGGGGSVGGQEGLSDSCLVQGTEQRERGRKEGMHRLGRF